MAKLQTLISIVSGYLSNSQLNTNFSRISQAFQNTLSLDGSSPNAMQADLDMNSNRIINNAAPVASTDFVTLGYADANYGGTLLTQSQAAAASASASAASASSSAASAALLASGLSGTSTTSTLIGTGVKVFTTQSGKAFDVGRFILLASAANASNYMHGQVVTYVGTTLTMNITNIGGSGTFADWDITVSGTQGPQGPAGGGGPGSGDLLSTNNLSDVASASTSRSNLGLSDLATLFFVNHEVPAGAINGANTTFTMSATPTLGTERVTVNGMLLRSGAGNDYTISGATITVARAPATGEHIEVSYFKP